MKPLTKSQLKSYRLLRDKGLPAREARRIARLSYTQLAREIGRRLREKSERAEGVAA